MTMTIHEHAESLLTQSIERDEWDEIPMLSLMFESGEEGEDRPILILAGLAEGHPADVIMMLAQSVIRDSGPFADLPRTKPLGLCLFNEAWGVLASNPEDQAEIQAYMQGGGRLADHRLGREIKAVTSYDGETMRYEQFARGGKREVVDNDGMTGRVPDAIKKLWSTFMVREAGGLMKLLEAAGEATGMPLPADVREFLERALAKEVPLDSIDLDNDGNEVPRD